MEKSELKVNATPEAKDLKTDGDKTVTKPDTAENNITIPVKFNKEIRNLSIEEATLLAQKGLKYESIEKDYLALKELAQKENKSVPEFINLLQSRLKEDKLSDLTEKCGGNKEMAEHILSLENPDSKDNGFSEVKEHFPQFGDIEDLPSSVRENAKMKGTLLLDEYLRYLLSKEEEEKQTLLKQKSAQKSSMGPLANKGSALNPETEEFLKGLWK